MAKIDVSFDNCKYHENNLTIVKKVGVFLATEILKLWKQVDILGAGIVHHDTSCFVYLRPLPKYRMAPWQKG